MKWFLIPARTENIDRSIRKPVALSDLRPFFDEEEIERLAALGDGEIRCWAMSSGIKAQFDKMEPGDRVLISESGTGKFNYIAEVTAKITSKDLGNHLWPVKPRASAETGKRSSWEFIYFLKNLRPIDVEKERLIVLLDHEPKDFVNSARQLKTENLVSFEATNGPLLEWLRANAKLELPIQLAPEIVTALHEPIVALPLSTVIGRDYVPAITTLTYKVSDQVIPYNAEKVERGKKGHVDTQNALASFLQERGIDPRSPAAGEPDFDLAWVVGETVFIAEVKSTTPDNKEHQLRLGLGQVLWYRHRYPDHGRRVVAVLVPEHKPSNLDWLDLCQTLGVHIGWPGEFERVLEPTKETSALSSNQPSKRRSKAKPRPGK